MDAYSRLESHGVSVEEPSGGCLQTTTSGKRSISWFRAARSDRRPKNLACAIPFYAGRAR